MYASQYYIPYDDFLHRGLLETIFSLSGAEQNQIDMENRIQVDQSTAKEEINQSSKISLRTPDHQNFTGKVMEMKSSFGGDMGSDSIFSTTCPDDIDSEPMTPSNEEHISVVVSEKDIKMQFQENVMVPGLMTANLSVMPRVSPVWKYIGFSSEDPVKDFKMNAELTLNCICFLLSKKSEAFRTIIKV